MNPFEQSVFSMIAPCLPCCSNPTPPECRCALQIPILNGTPLEDYDEAVTTLADYATCYAYAFQGTGLVNPTAPATSLASSWDATTETLVLDVAGFTYAFASITVPAGAQVTFAWDAVPPGEDPVDISISSTYCYSTIDTIEDVFLYQEPGNTGSTVWTVAESGEYVLIFSAGSAVSAEFTITCDVAFTANQTIAIYDSGDPANPWLLEACPKLLMPAGTEWTGDWYASDTDAQTALDTQVVDCLAYTIGTLDNITASVTGSEFSAGLTDGDGNSGIEISDTWMAVSLVEGETVSISVSTSTTTVCIDGSGPVIDEEAFVDATLYDYAGNVILNATNSTASAASTSASDSTTVPYTGKYYFKFAGSSRQSLSGDCNEESATSLFEAEITSTGLTGPHTAQALYDAGLLCPAKLDCE